MPRLESPFLSIRTSNVYRPLALISDALVFDAINSRAVPNIQVQYASIGFEPVSYLLGLKVNMTLMQSI